MDDDGWVTEPDAIDTIVAMKELRPGDEVRIHDPYNNYHLQCMHGQIQRIREAERDLVGKRNAITEAAPWSSEVCVAQLDIKGGTWVVCRKNIAAWRRPGALKK